ncbi:MAG: hypothetical protein RLZZ04_541 [Cyanobacteriota bacterium]|jgi:hypothetical protein
MVYRYVYPLGLASRREPTKSIITGGRIIELTWIRVKTINRLR